MQRHQSSDVVYYTFSSLEARPELRHGISSRHGGVSQGIYASLNMSRSAGDDPAAVEENTERLCRAVGVRRETLVNPYQRHTANVTRVGRDERGTVVPNCDVLITDEPDVTLAMRFADCTPVMIFDPGHHAVALVHSGWRGTVQGAARAAVEALAATYGSRPGDMIAGIGPSIGPCCYEVGEEVVSAVSASFGTGDGLLRAGRGARPHLDLWAANTRWLSQAGVRQVEVSGICTACHNDEFYSYRAGHGRTGHFAALLALRDGA